MSIINVRDAVSSAETYFKSVKDLLGDQIKEVRLEETELSEDKKFWLITLGYNVPTNENKSSILEGMLPRYQREYKTFKINRETGEVESMKIRQP